MQAAGVLTEVAIPAGDSVGLPGWDGEVMSESENSWIPKGKSFWELSCEGRVTTKANREYAKRTKETSHAIRKAASLVFVSGRRWSQKKKWRRGKQDRGEWREVRAYDPDDIEQWLEQSPAITLEFGDELGITGQGVESLAKCWATWSQQSHPPISPTALFVERDKARTRLIEDLGRRLRTGQSEPYAVRADSVEEAAAFACAALLGDHELGSAGLVVNESSGWRFVEGNPTLKVAVAARPEIAEKPAHRVGLVVVIPYATGDMQLFSGTAARHGPADLTLDRPSMYEFEKVLISLGVDEGDAKRLAVTSGRSWSVFRRRRATNPAIRRPPWLDSPEATALSTLCLLGGWSGGNPVDREIVARLSARPYEEIERDLRRLARRDDAPVLEIGEVWKVKSPLELVDLFGDRITRDELDRFLAIAREILLAPDPELELPDEQRYAARIYGKVRPQSELLIEAVCDTLVKLAVRGPYVPALSSVNIASRIAAVVREVLHDADATRWLSLAAFLPSLAEAAPHDFLRAAEGSLARPDAAVTQLLRESSSGGLGRCWHSGLLWGLEKLGWAPDLLPRAALILARLAHIEVRGNWGNTPIRSLVNVFRSWLPQTAADLEQRIAVLDMLMTKEPDVTFDLLDSLLPFEGDTAFPSARPSWREDDGSAGHGVPEAERRGMLIAVADRLIHCADAHPNRIARLVEKIALFDPPRVSGILALANQFAQPSATDEEKETVRTALRERIYWHRNYDKLQGDALDDRLRPLENLYEKLAPEDLVVCHRWLFAESAIPRRVCRPTWEDPSRSRRAASRSRLTTSCRVPTAGPFWTSPTRAGKSRHKARSLWYPRTN